jgi:hypothetical protein
MTLAICTISGAKKPRRADGAEGTNKPKQRYCSGANDPPTFHGCFAAAHLTKTRREGGTKNICAS